MFKYVFMVYLISVNRNYIKLQIIIIFFEKLRYF